MSAPVTASRRLASAFRSGTWTVRAVAATLGVAASVGAEPMVDWNATVPSLAGRTLEISGRSRITVTDSVAPLSAAVLDLRSDDVWIHLPRLRPSRVDSLYRNQIRINGQPAVPGQNVRFDQHLQGTVVISHSSTFKALRLFTQANRTGDSLALEPNTYHRTAQLGSLNDKARSFRLAHGYMATLAVNEDGTGESRVWVADRQEVMVDQLPPELSGKVSFVRVMPWRWTAKKGWTNGIPAADALMTHWWYNWDNAASSTLDQEYVPMRHNMNWPAYANINTKPRVTHALGLNEPDRPDQANATVDQAIAAWPEMLKSGLRVGAPAPSDASVGLDWLYAFMAKADSLRYRVDFVPVHWYKGGQSASQFHGWLKAVHERTKRPLWVTEWNNGANWTCCTPTLDDQARVVGEMIRMLDTARFVERYSIYEWVGETRQMFTTSPTVLTRAGTVYRDGVSPMAYDDDMANRVRGACLSSPISPNIQWRGAWHQSPYVTAFVGDSVTLSPWPWAGGTWRWTGPKGFTSTERTIVLPLQDASMAGRYEAVHTNAAGCPSRLSFEVGVRSSTSVEARAPAAVGAWIRDGRVHLVGEGERPAAVVVLDLSGAVLERRVVTGPGSVDLRPWASRGFVVVRVEQAGKTSFVDKVLLLRR